jgi:hypothetical protein
VAPESERPPAWGAPASAYERAGDNPYVGPDTNLGGGGASNSGDSSYAGADESLGGSGTENAGADPLIGPEESLGASVTESAGDNPGPNIEEAAGANRYEGAGPSAGEWEPVAPVMVSGNGSGPVPAGRPAAGPWPLGAGHAILAKRREHRVLRGIRSGVVLTVIALALGVAVAAGLGVIVWLIATAIHHAAAN